MLSCELRSTPRHVAIANATVEVTIVEAQAAEHGKGFGVVTVTLCETGEAQRASTPATALGAGTFATAFLGATRGKVLFTAADAALQGVSASVFGVSLETETFAGRAGSVSPALPER